MFICGITQIVKFTCGFIEHCVDFKSIGEGGGYEGGNHMGKYIIIFNNRMGIMT